MRLVWLALTAVLAPPPVVPAQSARDEAVELYVRAVTALLGGASDATGTLYLAGELLGAGGRTIPSELPATVVDSLTAAGYSAQVAELAESGLWRVPRNQLFLMLREIDWMAGRKLARLRIDVGAGGKLSDAVAFTFRKDEAGGWALVEKGPAEGSSQGAIRRRVDAVWQRG